MAVILTCDWITKVCNSKLFDQNPLYRIVESEQWEGPVVMALRGGREVLEAGEKEREASVRCVSCCTLIAN